MDLYPPIFSCISKREKKHDYQSELFVCILCCAKISFTRLGNHWQHCCRIDLNFLAENGTEIYRVCLHSVVKKNLHL